MRAHLKSSAKTIVHIPIVLGNGKKLFGEGARPAAFTLVDNKVTTKGVLIARYKRAGNVVAGDFAMDPPTLARGRVARSDEPRGMMAARP